MHRDGGNVDDSCFPSRSGSNVCTMLNYKLLAKSFYLIRFAIYR